MCHVNKTTGRFPGNKKSDTMKPEDIYNGLEYTTKEINRTFKIKVNGLFNGKKINTLVGVYGLIKLVGVEMANKLLRRAFRCVKDAEHCKLRRGWGRCCSKSCAAQLREKRKPGYNPKRVAINNVRRQCWTDCPETERYPFSYDGADFDQWGDCEFGIHD